MFNIKIESYFSSAHFLRDYKGKCEQLHGHNWKVEVNVEDKRLDKSGMVLDFHNLKNKLKAVLERLDHKCLNDIPYFSAAGARLPDGQGSASGGKRVNPTSENIAQYIYKNLKPEVSNLRLVTVWESHNSCASYYEG